MWEALTGYWHYITAALAVIDLIIVLPVIAWVLSLKKEATSAIAWSLLVFFHWYYLLDFLQLLVEHVNSLLKHYYLH